MKASLTIACVAFGAMLHAAPPQHGRASWYGTESRVTATGGTYNPSAFTAAHRTLPFGTKVRVTHLANQRSVTVVINDRGPYKKGRIIDLSRAAAAQLGMLASGTASVKVAPFSGPQNVASK